MPPEPQIPPDRIKELATAAIVKRREQTKAASGRRRIVPRISERQMLELTKALSDFYGFAAVPRSNKEHREMANIVSESWVPLTEYERQVLYKEEAEALVEELRRENAQLRARVEQALKDVPGLKSTIRAALARLVVDTQEKHVKEEWAVVLLRRMEAARDILSGELDA
jgi:hypothetical protein